MAIRCSGIFLPIAEFNGFDDDSAVSIVELNLGIDASNINKERCEV